MHGTEITTLSYSKRPNWTGFKAYNGINFMLYKDSQTETESKMR